jgi:hypothetical protein
MPIKKMTKTKLMKIVESYIKAEDYDSAINFITNFPLENVSIPEEIKRIEALKYKIDEPEKIVEKPIMEIINPLDKSEKEDVEK